MASLTEFFAELVARLAIPDTVAIWLLILSAPICLWAALSDLRSMCIPNKAVYALFGVFVVVGFITLPLPVFGWQIVHMLVLLAAGILINAAGLVGAGDAKFLAAAGPYLWLADLSILLVLFAVVLLAAVVTHRIAKHSALRRLAPTWQSWDAGRKFPMGFPLAATLSAYLLLGAF